KHEENTSCPAAPVFERPPYILTMISPETSGIEECPHVRPPRPPELPPRLREPSPAADAVRDHHHPDGRHLPQSHRPHRRDPPGRARSFGRRLHPAYRPLDDVLSGGRLRQFPSESAAAVRRPSGTAAGSTGPRGGVSASPGGHCSGSEWRPDH